MTRLNEMSPDDFEHRLASQPIRQMPDEWRANILTTASRAVHPHVAVETSAENQPWWKAWLWPCPQAWASMAAAWIVVLLLNAFSTESHSSPHGQALVSAPSVLNGWRYRNELLAQLTDEPALDDSNAPKPPVLRPRSHYGLHKVVAA
jgi:hypothetical protein